MLKDKKINTFGGHIFPVIAIDEKKVEISKIILDLKIE